MAANSRIEMHKCGDQLRLDLKGDFDGSMAMQVLCCIEDTADPSARIIIETDRLRRLEPFGIDVIKRRIRTVLKPKADYCFVGSKSKAFMGN